MTVFVTGTDTDVGKTVASAWIMLHLQANYWKPVQCGLEPATDAQTIKKITECDDNRILPTVYELKEPLSPHEAAKRAGEVIELEHIHLPTSDRPLVVEGAGGLLVPLNRKRYIADLIKHLDIPLILVARSTLGTINHTLLSIEAIIARKLDLLGVVLVGPKMPHNREAIETYGQVSILGKIPHLEDVNKDALLSIKPEPEFYDLLD